MSSDNWSLGVLIYTLLEGANPFYFDGMDQTTLFNVVCKENPYPMTEGVSSQAKNLVHRLLEKEPSQRLGSFRPKDVTMHEWFSDLCFSDLRRKRVKAPWVPAPLTFEE